MVLDTAKRAQNQRGRIDHATRSGRQAVPCKGDVKSRLAREIAARGLDCRGSLSPTRVRPSRVNNLHLQTTAKHIS